MTKYERLLEKAQSESIVTIENYSFDSNRIKGLYCDNSIAISSTLPSSIERSCVLIEELGHHFTSAGNIIDISDTNNAKQELKARIWAYNKLVGLYGIINCYKAHCCNRFEMASHLEVTEEFLSEALKYYKNKYGTYTTIDNYIINFEPYLFVLEKLE